MLGINRQKPSKELLEPQGDKGGIIIQHKDSNEKNQLILKKMSKMTFKVQLKGEKIIQQA